MITVMIKVKRRDVLIQLGRTNGKQWTPCPATQQEAAGYFALLALLMVWRDGALGCFLL